MTNYENIFIPDKSMNKYCGINRRMPMSNYGNRFLPQYSYARIRTNCEKYFQPDNDGFIANNIDYMKTVNYKNLLTLNVVDKFLDVITIRASDQIFIKLTYKFGYEPDDKNVKIHKASKENEFVDELIDSVIDFEQLYIYNPPIDGGNNSLEYSKSFTIKDFDPSKTCPFTADITIRTNLNKINAIVQHDHLIYETALHHLVSCLNRDYRIIYELSNNLPRNKLILIKDIDILVSENSICSYKIPVGIASKLQLAFSYVDFELTEREYNYFLRNKEIIINGNVLWPLSDHINFKYYLDSTVFPNDIPYDYLRLINFTNPMNAYCLYYHKQSDSIVPLCYPIGGLYY